MDRSELFEKIYKEKSFVYNKFFNNFEKDFRLLKVFKFFITANFIFFHFRN